MISKDDPLSSDDNEQFSDTDDSAFKTDPKLLEMLICPVSKTTLEYDAKNQELISHRRKLAFPIRRGVPIMLEEEARKLED